MSEPLDLVGKKFYRWTVLKRVENDSHGFTRWLCQCDCGNTGIVLGNSLSRGKSKSCGCLRREVALENGRKRVKHGHYHERLYGVWTNMLDRCYNENNDAYKFYGARGIAVCDEWRVRDSTVSGYVAFREWAYSHGYDESAKKGKCTIDRIDTMKGYFPENCRFIDSKAQNSNRRSNYVTYINGERFTLTQLAEKYGIKRPTLSNRVHKQGMSIEEAITLPVRSIKTRQKETISHE